MHRSESHRIDVAAILAFCRAEPSLTVQGSGAGFIRGVSFDSRDIREGFVFVAVQGAHRDGRDFLGLALRAGAQVILTDQRPLDVPDGVLLLQVSEPRQLAARLAAWFYAPHPAGQVLVTGTNGKTSIADYTRQLWQTLGYPAASIGTLGIIIGDETAKGSLTSPDAATLAQNLQHIQGLGIERVCIEASSHGLDQYRLEGTVPRVGVFSGLGYDHLDYHESPENYLAAKL